MKNSILALFLMFSALLAAPAKAETFPLPKDALSVRPVQHFSVQFGEMCPPNAKCFVNGTTVTLEYYLNGCLNKMLPLQYRVQKSKGKAVIFLTALEIETRGSQLAKCIRAPVAVTTISLINHFGPVEIRYTQNSAPFEIR